MCVLFVCVVLKLYENGSLLGYLQREPIKTREMIRILRGVAAGMAHLHAQNIVHRDLAARNILVRTLSRALPVSVL